MAPFCSELLAAQFPVDKRARASESEFGGPASTEELFPWTHATTSSPEEPPLTAIPGKVRVKVICIIDYHQRLGCEYTRDPLAGTHNLLLYLAAPLFHGPSPDCSQKMAVVQQQVGIVVHERRQAGAERFEAGISSQTLVHPGSYIFRVRSLQKRYSYCSICSSPCILYNIIVHYE